MAYITGKSEHSIHRVKIEVLQPTDDEADFEDGLKTQLEIESMDEYTTNELREIAHWLIEKADHIDQIFNSDGSCKGANQKEGHTVVF